MSPEDEGPFMVRAGASARGGDPRHRGGMSLDRAFFRVGELWARYKTDRKLFCSLQDDDFTVPFRKRFDGHVRTP